MDELPRALGRCRRPDIRSGDHVSPSDTKNGRLKPGPPQADEAGAGPGRPPPFQNRDETIAPGVSAWSCFLQCGQKYSLYVR
jgi:hypothetical protein